MLVESVLDYIPQEFPRLGTDRKIKLALNMQQTTKRHFDFIEIWIDAEFDASEFYTIFTFDDHDLVTPMLNGRIIFFARPEMPEAVIRRFAPHLLDSDTAISFPRDRFAM